MELDTVDCKGKNPAHYAAKHGSMECLKCLVRSAVDITTGKGPFDHFIFPTEGGSVHTSTCEGRLLTKHYFGSQNAHSKFLLCN